MVESAGLEIQCSRKVTVSSNLTLSAIQKPSERTVFTFCLAMDSIELSFMKRIQDIGREMVYPGRFLLLGSNRTHLFHMNGVTARSISSRAKRYVYRSESNKVAVASTDARLMAQGDLSLLDYTAVRLFPNGLVIGNGRQTDLVQMRDSGRASAVLAESLLREEYEHDAYCTPRITGCSVRIEDAWSQALHIIRSKNGESIREVFEIDIDVPCSSFLSTYAGPNVRPTPSFTGKPVDVFSVEGSAQEIAEAVYESFAPSLGRDDLRVSVVVVLIEKKTGLFEQYVVNAVDRTVGV